MSSYCASAALTWTRPAVPGVPSDASTRIGPGVGPSEWVGAAGASRCAASSSRSMALRHARDTRRCGRLAGRCWLRGGVRAAVAYGETEPVGIAYAVWAGLGTVGTTAGAAVLFGERLSLTAVAGIATVIVGTTLINLGATTTGECPSPMTAV